MLDNLLVLVVLAFILEEEVLVVLGRSLVVEHVEIVGNVVLDVGKGSHGPVDDVGLEAHVGGLIHRTERGGYPQHGLQDCEQFRSSALWA